LFAYVRAPGVRIVFPCLCLLSTQPSMSAGQFFSLEGV
jgi:hypothetical protein